MKSGQSQAHTHLRSLRFVIMPVCLVIVVAGLIITLAQMEPDTAPDVKILVTGYTNTAAGKIAAEFKITNFSRRSIKVYNSVTIDPTIAPGTLILIGSFINGLGPNDVIIGAGESHKFQVSFPSVSQWRGVFDLMWDSPGQNLVDWVRGQPWKRHLPPSWLKQRVSRYEFSSRWIASEVNESDSLPAAAPTPFSHILSTPDPIR